MHLYEIDVNLKKKGGFLKKLEKIDEISNK